MSYVIMCHVSCRIINSHCPKIIIFYYDDLMPMSGGAASNCVKNKLALLWRKALSNTFSFTREEKKGLCLSGLVCKRKFENIVWWHSWIIWKWLQWKLPRHSTKEVSCRGQMFKVTALNLTLTNPSPSFTNVWYCYQNLIAWHSTQ